MSRHLSNPVPAVTALLLLASAGACQALAGLSSLEIDASGSGGDPASSSSALTGSTTTTATASASSSDSSASSSTSGGGDGGGGGQGGDGTTSGGGQGGGGAGGDGGTGGSGGDGGSGTTASSSASSSSSTGGGTCSDEEGCAVDDVCHVMCDDEGCGAGTCHACSDGPPMEDPGMCPPFCEGDCKALDLCEFDNVSGVPGFGGPNLHLNTGIANMRLDCTTATPCVNKTVQCRDPNLDGPRSGAYDCTLRCESAAACQNIVFDCSDQAGGCFVECSSAGACDDVEVTCGPNKCIGQCNGVSEIEVDEALSCGADFTDCD